jgi:hypothetical protein
VYGTNALPTVEELARDYDVLVLVRAKNSNTMHKSLERTFQVCVDLKDDCVDLIE